MRLGLLGCGYAAREIHAPRLARMAGVEVTGVADVSGDAARRVSALLGDAPVFADLDGLVAGGCEAVAICTPVHGEHVRAALERGLDVFVEKPLCETPEEAAELAALAAARERILLTGAMRRFEPAVAFVAERIERIAPLRWVELRDYASAARVAAAPADDLSEPVLQARLQELGVGSPRGRRILQTLLLEFIHDLSAVDAICGVQACADAAASPDGWSLTGRLDLTGGVPCVFGVAEFGVPQFPVFDSRFAFVGERGLIELELGDANATEPAARVAIVDETGTRETHAIAGDPYAREWEAFLAAVRERRPLDDGRRDVELLWQVAAAAGALR